jgi:hypothetical protein
MNLDEFYVELSGLIAEVAVQPVSVEAPALRSRLNDLRVALQSTTFAGVEGAEHLDCLWRETCPPRQTLAQPFVLRRLRAVQGEPMMVGGG